ncbi:hypothetical protein NQ318_002216 [Aromia moschata]|uniref:Cyclic nucleotide-binding domain-containing protein n=1 Tax=Aromia moschata TaxID=1265417 RepID=A0AAV8Z2X9_9CUCU|nr:hypothetical protein NQ318_002216 [Aromia moschata]
MSENIHICSLSKKENSGFPKLPPNASCGSRFIRRLRKFVAINPNNARCKTYFRNRSGLITEAKKYAASPYFFVIHPFSNCHAFLEVTFFVAWLYSLFLSPLVVFYPVPNSDTLHDKVEYYFVLNVQRLLVISFFFTGYVDKKSQNIIIEPKKIILRYLRTYFIFDLIATGSVTSPVEEYVQKNYAEYFYFSVKSAEYFLIVLCYYVRFNTVTNYMTDIFQILKLPRRIQSILGHVLRTYLILHLFTCMLYGIPRALYNDHWPEESWLTKTRPRPEDGTILPKYLDCLMVASCYFFGASHDLYNVDLPNEQLCLSIVTLFGRLYTLFLLADLLRVFGIAQVAESNYEQELCCLEEYMTSKNLPEKLRKRLRNFYEYKLRRRLFNEREIFSTLSEHLRTELFLFSARKLIQRLFVFRSVPKPVVSSLISLMKMEIYSPREIIIKMGTTVENVSFISSGTVSVINQEGTELCHLEDADEFGIISSVTDDKQIYQIEAVEPTEIIYINKQYFLNILHNYGDVLAKMDEMVKQRLARLMKIQEHIKKGGSNIISDLRNGNLLERFHKRPLIVIE